MLIDLDLEITRTMVDAFNTDNGKSWELVEEFDVLRLENATTFDQGSSNIPCKANDPNPNLPGMTAEYRDFINCNLPSGIVSLEDLQKLVYIPLKQKYPEKFHGDRQDVDFFTAYTVDGKKFYRQLSGNERDIAVQKDVFEQAKRRKVIEMYIQSLRFKLLMKRQDLGSIKQRCDPANVYIFENLMESIEVAIDRGVSCEATLKQLDRFIVFSWILFFEKDMATKRKSIDSSQTTHVAYDQSSKRKKGNPREGEVHTPTINKGNITSSNAGDVGSVAINDSSWNTDGSEIMHK